MIKAFRWSYFCVLSAAVFLFCFAVGAYAAEPGHQPKIPEPISPLFPTPDVHGVPQRGDVVRGERIYQSWGCPSCHTLDGKGGKMGPDLARTGEIHRDPYWFRRYLSNPRSIIPNSVKPPVKLSDPDMDDLIAYLMSLSRFRQGIR
ncbi:MAG: c-type cytochrome [Candidatus Binatia bacterium]